MKKVKVLIIFVIIIIITLIGLLVFVSYNKNEDTNNNLQNHNTSNNTNTTQNQLNNNEIDENNSNSVNNGNTTNTLNPNTSANSITELTAVKDRTNFFTVKSLVEKYLNYISSNNSEAVYSVLDKAYTNQVGITKDNVLQKVTNITETQIYTANKMEVAETQNKEIYLIYGTRRDDILNSRGQEIEFNATVILNKINDTYSLIPGILNVKTSYEKVGVISSNDYNKYSYINVEDMTMANLYFVNYKSKLLNNLQEAYSLLDEQYKEKRFKTFTQFSDYINSNKEKINRMNLNKYIISDGTYTCIDQYNNYYIFKESAIMEYKVMLDDYNIPSNKFIEEYNNLSMQKKIEQNIQNFIKMINNKDYENAYSKLNQEFRNNNFRTLEEFKTYINNTFYNYNDVTFDNYETEGDIGVYKVKINGVVDYNDVSFTKTIIMKLGTGTEFEMSFDI